MIHSTIAPNLYLTQSLKYQQKTYYNGMARTWNTTKWRRSNKTKQKPTKGNSMQLYIPLTCHVMPRGRCYRSSTSKKPNRFSSRGPPVISTTFNSPLSVKIHTMAATSYPPHFSEPWKWSDVVLVVEDQRFHVHRSTLAFWSPVFERMLTVEFKEKDNAEIFLPGKKASECEEMLQMMYPSLEEKSITQRNCYFLFELAHEYQIDAIAQKCINLMVSMVKSRAESDVLGMLVYAQMYQIKSLISTCIFEARRLSLNELTWKA